MHLKLKPVDRTKTFQSFAQGSPEANHRCGTCTFALRRIGVALIEHACHCLTWPHAGGHLLEPEEGSCHPCVEPPGEGLRRGLQDPRRRPGEATRAGIVDQHLWVPQLLHNLPVRILDILLLACDRLFISERRYEMKSLPFKALFSIQGPFKRGKINLSNVFFSNTPFDLEPISASVRVQFHLGLPAAFIFPLGEDGIESN
jgi:hypothetical protein